MFVAFAQFVTFSSCLISANNETQLLLALLSGQLNRIHLHLSSMSFNAKMKVSRVKIHFLFSAFLA